MYLGSLGSRPHSHQDEKIHFLIPTKRSSEPSRPLTTGRLRLVVQSLDNENLSSSPDILKHTDSRALGFILSSLIRPV